MKAAILLLFCVAIAHASTLERKGKMGRTTTEASVERKGKMGKTTTEASVERRGKMGKTTTEATEGFGLKSC